MVVKLYYNHDTERNVNLMKTYWSVSDVDGIHLKGIPSPVHSQLQADEI